MLISVNKEQFNQLLDAAIFAGSVLYVKHIDLSERLALNKLTRALGNYGIDLDTEAMKTHCTWLKERRDA